MALDPEIVKKERDATPQFQISGIIGKSTLLEHTECIDTYTSNITTETEKIDFQYDSLTNEECLIDSIFEVVEKPFKENTKVYVSVTQKEPHIMVTGNVIYTENSVVTPSTTSTFPTTQIIGIALFFIILITIGVLRILKNKNNNA